MASETAKGDELDQPMTDQVDYGLEKKDQVML